MSTARRLAAKHPPVPPVGHPTVTASSRPKTAVLLVNLGTPDAPTPAATGRYLTEFLSDSRVIPLPKLLWQPILRLFVIPFRRKKSAHAYATVWGDDSPLRTITAAQTAALQQAFSQDNLTVAYAMRYGNPSIPAVLDDLKQRGIERLLLAPLYPQYAAATVATVVDAVGRWQARQTHQFTLRTLPPYYAQPAYIKALAASVAPLIKAHQPEVIITSFHGLPLKTCQQGDVYYCHSHKTARLLAATLGLPFTKTVADATQSSKKPRLLLTFQSRFGAQQWLMPYTDIALADLAHSGVKNVLVIAPGFAADCVETLEELGLRAQETFLEHGGETFTLAPCLNATAPGLTMLETLLQQELQGWL